MSFSSARCPELAIRWFKPMFYWGWMASRRQFESFSQADRIESFHSPLFFRKEKFMKPLLLSIAGMGMLSISASAQTTLAAPAIPAAPADRPNVFFYQSMAPLETLHPSMKPVLNAPYQAQIVSETSQHLSDGNVIQNSHTSKVARDSQGRTWREETIEKIGPWASNGGPQTIVFISDPVAKTSYVLHPDTKTAEKLPAHGMLTISDGPGPGAAAGATISIGEAGPVSMAKTVVIQRGAATTSSITAPDKDDATVEDLGTQQINGVTATGKRTTRTIPANTIGNQLPIVSTDETWYSPDLKTVVESKHDDPRFGESTFSLTNIQKGEPPADLFQVPSDYTISTGPPSPPPMSH
jgi:hypothetical protein